MNSSDIRMATLSAFSLQLYFSDENFRLQRYALSFGNPTSVMHHPPRQFRGKPA